jgi:hypothetical protein
LIPNAPKPVAPYSHVVEADGWLFVTGQPATDPDDDSLPLPKGIEAQTRKVMDNLKRALAGRRCGLRTRRLRHLRGISLTVAVIRAPRFWFWEYGCAVTPCLTASQPTFPGCKFKRLYASPV